MPARRGKFKSPYELLDRLLPGYGVRNAQDLAQLIDEREAELAALRRILAVCQGTDEPPEEPPPEAVKTRIARVVAPGEKDPPMTQISAEEFNLRESAKSAEVPCTAEAPVRHVRPRRGRPPKLASQAQPPAAERPETRAVRQLRLVQLAQAGSRDARNLLIEDLEPAIGRLAAKRAGRGRGVERDDLVQVGRIGANDAIDRFDPERGIYVSTFVLRRAVGAMIDHQRSMGYFLEGGKRTMPGRPARTERIASIDGLRRPRGDQNQANRRADWEPAAAPDVLSIDETEQEFEALLTRLGLNRNELRLRRILRARFVHGKTHQQIAEQLGLNASRVSQLFTAALARLKEELDPPLAKPITRTDLPPLMPELAGIPTICDALADLLEKGGNPKPELAELGRQQIARAKAALNARPDRRVNIGGIERLGGVRRQDEVRAERSRDHGAPRSRRNAEYEPPTDS